MHQAKSGFPLHILISLVAILAVLLLALLGTMAYWRLESLVWASHKQTQVVLDSLVQKTEEIDGEMAAVLQELEAMRSRIEALEAGRLEISNLDKQLDDLSAIREDLATLREELHTLRGRSDLQTGPTLPEEEPSTGPASASPQPEARPEGAIEITPLGVPLYKQAHRLSCEATTASMVAAFFGVSLSEEEAIAALPHHENPHLGFRGDIDGSPGGLDDYGVYAGPIQKLLTEYGLQATIIEGGLEGIRSALQAGHPVIAWITYHLWEERPVELELASGATVKVVPYEHTVVIEGYTADGLWALDPYDGERQLLPWADFERSWGYLDQMALEVMGP